MVEVKNLKVEKEVHTKLTNLKKYKRETYSDIIERLIKREEEWQKKNKDLK